MNCGPIARGSRGCSLGSRRWTNAQDGTTHWRSITRENVTTLYRIDPTSRISDPTEARRVFSYLISRSFDDQGNVLLYDDLADDGAGVDAQARVNEGNRPPLVRQTQRNLKRVRYGNATPPLPGLVARPDGIEVDLDGEGAPVSSPISEVDGVQAQSQPDQSGRARG